MDFNGPYLRFGGISILVIIDLRSRYAIARPVKSTVFNYTRRILDEVFEREGFPKAIKTDNGPPFNGEEYGKYCSDRGIQTIYSTPFFPQQNGLAESFMKVINKAMSTAVSSGNSYAEELQDAVHAYNAGVHSVIKVAPEEVMMGRKIKRFLPLLERGRTNYDDKLLDRRDREVKLKGKNLEDKRRGAKDGSVKPGDTVIIERQCRGKGDTRFDVKRFTVIKVNKGNLLLSDDAGRTVKRHVSQTKKVGPWRKSPQTGIDSKVDREEVAKRPERVSKTPQHLSDYIH